MPDVLLVATACAVPCPARKDTCARANPPSIAMTSAHYPGGTDCPGFVPLRQCGNCSQWKRGDAPKGRMPGVHEESRPCGRPRMEKDIREWRRPTDACDQWTG